MRYAVLHIHTECGIFWVGGRERLFSTQFGLFYIRRLKSTATDLQLQQLI